MSTWSQARQTFGDGEPTGGASFDGSASLRQIQADVESAGSGERWSGGAAAAYEARNARQSQVLARLADLDAQLAAEIDKSAYVVSAGRRDLDDVRDWVVSAASSVPDTPAGKTALMPIVSKGMADLSDVMLKSNGELNTIGAKIQKMGLQYSALGGQTTGPPPLTPAEDDLPWDETTWYAEWEALNREVQAHNAALAAHLRVRPPPGSPPALTGPWNSQTVLLNANAQRIYREQMAKVAEAAEMGISVDPPSPPPVVENPEDAPLGVAPARVPITAATAGVEKPRPA